MLSLVQANSSSDLSQILILQFLLPRAFLPPSPSLLNFTLAKHLFNTILIKSFIRFPFLPYLIRPHTTTLSKLDNTVNSSSIFNKKHATSLQNGRCSLIFTTIPYFSTKNPLLSFSQFSPPYSTLTCLQNYPYNPH